MTHEMDMIIELIFSVSAAFFAVVTLLGIAFAACHEWKKTPKRDRVAGIILFILGIFVIAIAAIHAALTIAMII